MGVLAWALIGYASLFDLKLGHALTELVAGNVGAEQGCKVPKLVWTSLLLGRSSLEEVQPLPADGIAGPAHPGKKRRAMVCHGQKNGSI